MKLGYYKQLDGVRAVAALMVMLVHFFLPLRVNGNTIPALQKYSVLAQTGVSLFFVLSGFVITRILLATKESPNYFSDFYIRRSLRIFPLYYFFLLLFYFVVPLLLHSPVIPFGRQVYYWVYLQNFAKTFNWPSDGPVPLWSLAVEEHFYLLWPCLVFFLNKKGIKAAVAVMLLVSFVTRLILLHNNLEVFYFTFARLDEISLGALLAVWESEGKLKNSTKKFAIGLALTILPTVFLWMKVTGKAVPAVQAIKFNLTALSCFCVIGVIITMKAESLLNKVLSSKVFSFSGKVSYGLYIYHSMCFGLIELFCSGMPVLLRFILSFGAVYVVAYLSYNLLEVRFIKLKDRFSYNRLSAKGVEENPVAEGAPAVGVSEVVGR